ncbi:MAG: glutamine synthetase type III, partial [Oscillospiraceae bacterium]
NYCKTVRIEAQTMVNMAKREIMPAVESYVSDLASAAAAKTAVDAELPCCYEKKLLRKLSALVDMIDTKTDALELTLVKIGDISDITEEANAIRDEILPAMCELRAVCDEAETLTSAKYWPFPTYGDLLFGVK